MSSTFLDSHNKISRNEAKYKPSIQLLMTLTVTVRSLDADGAMNDCVYQSEKAEQLMHVEGGG